MAIQITGDTMTLEIDNCVVATARAGEHTAAGGSGAWIVSTHPARLFTRDQAITALTIAELLAAGCPGNDPRVTALRSELAGDYVPFPGVQRGDAPQVTAESSQFVMCAEHGNSQVSTDYDGPVTWIVCDGQHSPAGADYLARYVPVRLRHSPDAAALTGHRPGNPDQIAGLIAFLGARLAEEEAAAKATSPDGQQLTWKAGSEVNDEGTLVHWVVSDPDQAGVAEAFGLERDTGSAIAAHIARHDPARTLRRVAAIRRVIERYVRGQDDGYLQACLDAIKDAAAIWDDHPGYQEAWKP